WNTMAFSTAQPAASTAMVPAVCRSRPARMRSRVDFPQPLGPTMQRNSPAATRRSKRSMATTEPCAPAYSRRRPAISTAAPRRCIGCLPVRAFARASATALELAVLVLERERPKRLLRVIGVAVVHQPLDRQPAGRELVLDEPVLHVEQTLGVELAVQVARRPRVLVEQVGPGLVLALDQQVDELLADRSAVIAVAVVADALCQCN